MPELTAVRRHEIERRWMHAKELAGICDDASLPVPLLVSALGAARDWGEQLYKRIETEDEARVGRELQAKLDTHLECTLLYRRTKDAPDSAHYPYPSRYAERIANMLANTGLNEAKRRQLLDDLCERGERDEEPLLRPDILAGNGKKDISLNSIRRAQDKIPGCASLMAFSFAWKHEHAVFAVSNGRQKHSRTM